MTSNILLPLYPFLFQYLELNQISFFFKTYPQVYKYRQRPLLLVHLHF